MEPVHEERRARVAQPEEGERVQAEHGHESRHAQQCRPVVTQRKLPYQEGGVPC